MSAPSLLRMVQGLLTRTYALEARLDPIERYLIGDAGLSALYDRPTARAVRSAAGEGARLLLRDDAGGIRACVYYPDAMIRRLEERPPQHGLDADNVDAFGVFVEEIDHLLLTAERAHDGRGVSLLELELHAGVSKYLVLARFVAGGASRLGAARRAWLRHHLFEKPSFSDGDREVRHRYVAASRHAAKFLDSLERVPVAHRLGRLRRFHRESLGGKLAMAASG